jgi:DNA-directed RNA polymerase subunit E'/Rpb7
MPNMISTKIHLKISEVGDSTKQNLQRKIVQRTAGKCIPEGYVRPDSVEVITYSSGVIKLNLIEFQVVFSCLICNPSEGHEVECITKTITKAGIHAEVVDENTGFIPMKVFLARDHNYSNSAFSDIKENIKIRVRIIGKRFELNDPYIVAIASLVEGKGNREWSMKPRITLLGTDVETIQEEEQEQEQEQEQPEVQAPISIPTLVETPKPQLGEIEEGEIEEGEIEEE